MLESKDVAIFLPFGKFFEPFFGSPPEGIRSFIVNIDPFIGFGLVVTVLNHK